MGIEEIMGRGPVLDGNAILKICALFDVCAVLKVCALLDFIAVLKMCALLNFSEMVQANSMHVTFIIIFI